MAGSYRSAANGSALLARRLDILAACAAATEPIRALFVRRTRLFVRAGVLLIVGVAHGLFGIRLLHGDAPFAKSPERIMRLSVLSQLSMPAR
jgi:hypothetical protein